MPLSPTLGPAPPVPSLPITAPQIETNDFPLIDDEDAENQTNSGSCNSSAFSTPARNAQSSYWKNKGALTTPHQGDGKPSQIDNKQSDTITRSLQKPTTQQGKIIKAEIGMPPSGSNSILLPATPLTDPAKFGIPVRRASKEASSAKVSGSKARKIKGKEDIVPTSTKLSPFSSTSSKAKVSDASLASPEGKLSNTSIPNSPSKYSNCSTSSSSVMSGNKSTATTTSSASVGCNVNSGGSGKKTFMQTISGIFKTGTPAGNTMRTLASPEADFSAASVLSNEATTSPSIPSTGSISCASTEGGGIVNANPSPASAISNDINNSQERKSRSDTFMRFAKGLRSSSARPQTLIKGSTTSNQEQDSPKTDNVSSTKSLVTDSEKITPTRHPTSFRAASLSMRISHPSTPPVPLSRKITIGNSGNYSSTKSALVSKKSQDDDSFSDFDAEADDFETSESPESSLNVGMSLANVAQKGTSKKYFDSTPTNIESTTQKQVEKETATILPPEILEKLMRRGGKTAKRAAKLAQIRRVRKAQEIQRELEELDVKHKTLEKRGIKAERSLRGEDILDDEETAKDYEDGGMASDDDKENGDHPVTIQMWFALLAEKNALVRREQELLVQAKMLELEDRSSRLEAELREQHLLLDRPPSRNEPGENIHGSQDKKSVAREGQILTELLDISEQRELLQSMLTKDRARYKQEDIAIEEQMKASGLRVS